MKAVAVYLNYRNTIACLFLLFSISIFAQKTETTDSINYYEQKIHKEVNASKKAFLHYNYSNYLDAQDSLKASSEEAFKALEIFENIGNKKMVAECNLLLHYKNSAGKNNKIAKKFLDRYYQYALKVNDPKKLAIAHKSYGVVYWSPKTYKTSKIHFQKAREFAAKAQDSILWAKNTNNLALLLSGFENKQDSARYYYNKVLDFYQNSNAANERLITTYINLANSHEKEGNIDEALAYLRRADKLEVTQNNVFYKKVIYGKLSNYYKATKDYEKALAYKNKYTAMQDSLNQVNQSIAINELQTKYETEKKEKENALLKNDIVEKKQTQNILIIIVIASIILGTGISILIAKNAKRKQLLAKQKEKIRIQKIEKELKEQELSSIDVLIEGQEKERQRLAENLHDNLGGTLAALKLNLQNLEQHQSEPNIIKKSINNSLNLINDAYQSVRTMAHEKSSGVVASQGLLPAIQNFTNNISSEKLKIEIDHFGLKNRLENSLEIKIFRIIQELITNIIKHANATEANISLTNHNSTLNIIVEDNGKGFKQNFSKSKGVGIATIEKRIENLGGSLEIDSHPERGSSIIINLPI